MDRVNNGECHHTIAALNVVALTAVRCPHRCASVSLHLFYRFCPIQVAATHAQWHRHLNVTDLITFPAAASHPQCMPKQINTKNKNWYSVRKELSVFGGANGVLDVTEWCAVAAN